MNKYKFSLIVILCLMLVVCFTGCGKEKVAHQNLPHVAEKKADVFNKNKIDAFLEKNEPVEFKIPMAWPQPESVDVVDDQNEESVPEEQVNMTYFLFNDEVHETDLDGDGTLETWKITKGEEEDEYLYEAKVYINDELVEEVSDWGFYTNVIALVEFPNWNQKYILISDYGPSDDYLTTVISYSNGEVKYWYVEGIYENNTLSINADRTIVEQKRASILQTWWYYVTYDVTKDGLVKREEDFYEPIETDLWLWGSETKCDFEFYSKPDRDSEKIFIPMGAYVYFTGLDDEHWVEISYEQYDVTKYAYLYVDDFYIVDRNSEMTAEDLFEDLLMAD